MIHQLTCTVNIQRTSRLCLFKSLCVPQDEHIFEHSARCTPAKSVDFSERPNQMLTNNAKDTKLCQHRAYNVAGRLVWWQIRIDQAGTHCSKFSKSNDFDRTPPRLHENNTYTSYTTNNPNKQMLFTDTTSQHGHDTFLDSKNRYGQKSISECSRKDYSPWTKKIIKGEHPRVLWGGQELLGCGWSNRVGCGLRLGLWLSSNEAAFVGFYNKIQ